MNPLKNAKIVLPVIVLAVLPFIQDCRDPEVGPYPFQWVVNGARLTYDLHTRSGQVTNSRTLEVSVGTGTLPTMIFTEKITGQTNDPYKNIWLLGMFTKVLAKPDGFTQEDAFRVVSERVGARKNTLRFLIPLSPCRSCRNICVAKGFPGMTWCSAWIRSCVFRWENLKPL